MPRSLWSGSISFGLVNIPVQLVGATRSKQVHFHLLHAKDNARLKQKLICPVDKKEVPRSEAIQGYEVSPDRVVALQPKELDALLPKSSRAIEILDFAPLHTIDSIYFHQPYYLVPDERAAKAYRLLLEAMKETQKVA